MPTSGGGKGGAIFKELSETNLLKYERVCVCMCSHVPCVEGCPVSALSGSEQGHSQRVRCQGSVCPSSTCSCLPACLPLCCVCFTRQLLINSSHGISCSPPSLSCSRSKMERHISSFYETWIIKNPSHLLCWLCELTAQKLLLNSGGCKS